MSVIIEIRNPIDLTTTYSQIQIQRATSNSAGAMADISTSTAIDTTTASDLSTGYTSYEDASGEVGTHYYRFRYKNAAGTVVSGWSDIFAAGGNTLFSRFRRMMKDTNSNNYKFEQEDLEFMLEQAIHSLWPITWFETYSDTMIVPDGTTKIFNFSTGVTRVTELEFLDQNSDNAGKSIGWQVRGKMIIFDNAPATSYTIRAWIEKMFTKLAEVPEIWDSLLLNKMRLQAFEMMEGDRQNFYKYNTAAKPGDATPTSLNGIITRIEAQIARRENQLRRIRKPASIKLI